jgi:hypothetical protein
MSFHSNYSSDAPQYFVGTVEENVKNENSLSKYETMFLVKYELL